MAGKLFLFHRTVKVTTPKKMHPDLIEVTAPLIEAVIEKHLRKAQEEIDDLVQPQWRLKVQVTH